MEPFTASGGNRRQRFWLDFAASAPIRFATDCHQLQPRGSINAPSRAQVLDRGGSDTHTGERHVGDSAGRGGDLDVIVLLEALQSIPEPYASAEQDRDDHDVHVVDEPDSKEVADHGAPSADAYVLAVRGLAGRLERLGRRSVEEVERCTALHLDRRARVMGEDEDRRVERRVRAPPALPLWVLVPSGRAELPGTHDLGADPDIV